MFRGKNYKESVKLIDKNGETIPASKVKWSRSNKTVASVSKNGVVTGKDAGKIKITATDIDKQVIQHAQVGLYNAKSIAGVPADMKKKYFPQNDSIR